jgi:hypothetical protein
MRVACASAAGSPVVSITRRRPFPVRSIRGPRRAARRRFPMPPFSAPTVSARSRRTGTGSVVMTLAPAAVAASAVASPMGPAPRMTACSPPRGPPGPRACTAIDMGSIEGGRLGTEVADAEDLGRRDRTAAAGARRRDGSPPVPATRTRSRGRPGIGWQRPQPVQRPHGDPAPGPHATGAVPPDLLDDGGELVPLDPREA